MDLSKFSHWGWTVEDQALVEKWNSNLPDRIFDVHAHIYRMCDLGKQGAPYVEGPEIADHAVWKSCMEQFFGKDKSLSAIHVAPPCETFKEIEASNAFVLKEVADAPENRALILIDPDMGRERVEEYLKNDAVVGMKPFSYYAKYDGPKSEAPLSTFLPEWAWQCAHDHGLMFLVHLMRDRSLADPVNYEEIRTMAKKYPNARLMLDHCGRGFNSETIAEGIKYVADLPNLYFDTSSICEVMPMYTILRYGNPEHVVFGSDFPLTQYRGRTLTLGDGFMWARGHVLLGIENLRALQSTMEILNFSNAQRENMFFNNAMEMISGRK